MTSSQYLPDYLSANDLFKQGYSKYLRWATLVAMVLTVLFFWLMPRYEPTPYTLRHEEIVILNIEAIADIETPEEILPPPVIPVREIEAATSGFDEDIVIANTDDIFPPWVPKTTIIDNVDDGFVASSTKPVLILQPKPNYPEIARLGKLEGTVIVKVLVGVDGLVKETQVIQSAHPLLDKAAMAAAKRCRFKAGTQRSVPRQAWIAVPYTFRLH